MVPPGSTVRPVRPKVSGKTLAIAGLLVYTLGVHNQSVSNLLPFRAKPRPAAEVPAIRPATRHDAGEIGALISSFVEDGLMLPRTVDQIIANIDNYVVAVRRGGRVVACAALEEYSPSLAEVACVAVSRAEHGNGLGSLVVLGVEQLARTRDVEELFALSLSDRFFLSLGYSSSSISRYPEKLAKYDRLKTEGVNIVPKRCFQKTLSESGSVFAEGSPGTDGPPSRELKAG